MSLQDIREGLYTTLHTWGPFAASEMSACGYDVLETANACAIVFAPGDSTFEPLTYGASAIDARAWGIDGEIYIKDTGNPCALLGKVWQVHDDLYDTLARDRFLSGTAQYARLTRMAFSPVLFEAGGQGWARVEWTVIADEF